MWFGHFIVLFASFVVCQYIILFVNIHMWIDILWKYNYSIKWDMTLRINCPTKNINDLILWSYIWGIWYDIINVLEDIYNYVFNGAYPQSHTGYIGEI